MRDDEQNGLSHIVGHARRIARATIRKLGIGSYSAKPHRPLFDCRRLGRRLGIAPTLDGPSAIAHAGAIRARQQFGPRFFVDPVDIPQLFDQLETNHTKALEALFHRVAGDVHEGLPIYATTGPRLGSSFPWHMLPRGPGNDSMYSKRPHRFAYAPRHALASLRDPQAAVALAGMLEAWAKHAQLGRDHLCYDSNLAVIQRVLALSWTWAFLAARPPQPSLDGLELEWLVLSIIEADVRFLEPELGRSAPNNHLLADRFAAWYLRTVFPELLDRPRHDAEELWIDELLLQTYPDGGSFEHSSHYHEFACEMGSAYLLLAKRNGIAPDPRLEERVAALLDYQCALTGPEALPIPIGNAIEDTLFPLDAGESWCPGAIREINRALFRPHLPAVPPDDPTLVRAFWLLAGALSPGSEESSRERLPDAFPNAGLHILDDALLDGRIVLRTGPTEGTEVAAGHSHADILSVYMHVRGCPVLVDSGTYSYRRSGPHWTQGSPDWRGYLAGRAAHNGFNIDGHDPFGPMSGDFRRRELPGRVKVQHESAPGISFVASQWLGPGPYHGTHRLCVHVVGEYWLLLDTRPEGEQLNHPSWIGFQLAPGCRVQHRAGGVDVVPAGETPPLFVNHSGAVDSLDVLEGSLNPVGGWISPRYGELQAAPQLRYALSEQASSVAFLLTIDAKARNLRFVGTLSHDGAWLIHMQSAEWDDWIIFQPKGWSPWLLGDDRVEFDGRLLWARQERGCMSLLRWISGTRLDWVTQGVQLIASDLEPFDLALGKNAPPEWLNERFERHMWPGGG